MGAGYSERRARIPRDGFTFAEVSLAIALVVIMMLPLVAMLALGTDSVRDATEVTRATQIVDSLMAELKRSTARGGIVLRVGSGGSRAEADGGDYLRGLSFENIDGAVAILAFDEQGQVVEALDLVAYERGVASAPFEVTTLVRMDFDALPGEGFYETGLASLESPVGLVKVTVSVEHPVTAAQENRRKNSFTTYLNLTDER